MRLFKCGAVTNTTEYPYRDRCPARPHAHCGSGWCSEHHQAKCAGKCVDPTPPPKITPGDEVSRTDAASFDGRFRSVQAGLLWLSLGMVISTLCASTALYRLSAAPASSASILRWSTPSPLGDKSCSLIAPDGAAAGMLLCCREDSYSATGATCDITAEPAWFEPEDLRRGLEDRDAPGPALSFASGEKRSTHKLWVADPYAWPLSVDAGVSDVAYDRSLAVWRDIRSDMNRIGGAVEADAGTVEIADTGTILGILKKATFDDGGVDWMHSGYYVPGQNDAGTSTTTMVRTGSSSFYVAPPYLNVRCTADR